MRAHAILLALALIGSLAGSTALLGCKEATKSRNTDDPKVKASSSDGAVAAAPAKPKPKANKPMTIQVPVTASHKTCYDLLEKDAPTLISGFKKDAVDLANAPGRPWERLDKLLARVDELWAAYLNGGGNPRVTESSWVCAVGDLAEALVTASIDELASASEPERKERLDALEKIVNDRLQNAPNHTGMSLAIMAARHK